MYDRNGNYVSAASVAQAIAESQIPFDPNCCQSPRCTGCGCAWCNGCNHQGNE
jgi:hypothetical protein